MPQLDLGRAVQLAHAGLHVEEIGHLGAQRWQRPQQIAEFYGTGPGQIPMDHRYAQGTAVGGNITAVPNLGGAGAAFNLTAVGAIPVTADYVTMEPSARFEVATRAELVGTRLFIVADILAFTSNQNFAGRNVGGETTNIFLNAAGDRMTVNRNPGTGFVNAQINLSPPVAPLLRLYEVDVPSGGDLAVLVNTQLRGSVPTPFTTFGVSRIAAGQSISSGLNARLYRTLLLIKGGDFDAGVAVVRARLNDLYGLGL